MQGASRYVAAVLPSIHALPTSIAGIVSKNSFAHAMSAASASGNTAHFHPSSACITSQDSASSQVCILTETRPFLSFIFSLD